MMFAYELNSCLLILTEAYYCWGFCHIITQIISFMLKIIPSIPTATTPVPTIPTATHDYLVCSLTN